MEISNALTLDVLWLVAAVEDAGGGGGGADVGGWCLAGGGAVCLTADTGRLPVRPMLLPTVLMGLLYK